MWATFRRQILARAYFLQLLDLDFHIFLEDSDRSWDLTLLIEGLESFRGECYQRVRVTYVLLRGRNQRVDRLKDHVPLQKQIFNLLTFRFPYHLNFGLNVVQGFSSKAEEGLDLLRKLLFESLEKLNQPGLAKLHGDIVEAPFL